MASHIWRHLILTGMVAAVTIAAWNSAPAQTTKERENLTEPVLRVENSDSVPASRPIVESSIAPGTRPTVEKQTSDMTAAPQETKVASLGPKAIPRPSEAELAKSEPQRLLDEAVADAHESLRSIRRDIHDYTCLLIKREQVKGELLSPEFIEVKVRNRKLEDGQVVVPFSVYMKFKAPVNMRGREVLYIENAFKNQARVREGGTRGRFLPSVLLSPVGRLAMQGNRYPIYEVGIENLLERLIQRSEEEPEIDDCKVTYRPGAKINGRPCRFLQVVRDEPKTGEAATLGMNVYLAQVFIDEEWNIPIRYAAYDWPCRSGERPEVVEEYTYQNLEVNVGLTDRDFDYQNPDYNF